ncbi:hypothetical protein A1Q1_06351 [Trichosporon asahii var. asahii CBS 2479]|uniref:EKC/KEOPS complex subunit GON7 n=1 Tax=Trichosporon asahii var. asahii (strain ATCC 90039 / CBS 2479 / JCM 2466 / KCTC 7840 / NBRC 103889/ NCYC 2677 / UAMH 7654) TaxID=1186058 RepID=J6ERD8_TRIAS|nr:hypothetical protein A1Q1_06351 [Trichosporon asahii var. asahii CBS 2479]EJT45282.1 hypothetical protein A1Q1_06351 [Trichosporon asahii var. asahii CBS 2479]
MPSISFSYAVAPPEGITCSTPATKSQSVDFTPGKSDRSATNAYYEAATPALREAQLRLNELLTEWKDAVGDAEKQKEDRGKVAYGKGKAARLMEMAKKDEASDDSEDEDDEDESA